MPILSLPGELLHHIIIHCLIVRGVKRGVRLRLVCKQFDDMFMPALYQSRILDSFSAPWVGWEWWSRKDFRGSIELWHGYLVFRVLGERSPDVGRFIEIRNAAKALSHLSGDALSLDEAVHGFCWLALEVGTNCPGERQLWLKGDCRERWVVYPHKYRPPTVERALERQSGLSQRIPSSNAQLDLLCGAAYFDLFSVAEDLLQQSRGLSPTDGGGLFPSPIWIASFRGHVSMLDLFQRHVLSKASYTFSDDQSYYDWAHENTKDAITGAIASGNLDVLLSVLFPPSVRPSPPPISEAPKCLYGQSLMNMCYHRAFSPTPAMYDFIMDTFPDIHDEDRRIGSRRRNEVARYARDGNLEMVRHLMSANTKLHRGGFVRLADPLYRACEGGYEDTVEFLLGCNVRYNGDVLLKAIRVGSLSILRRLLDHDATVHNEEGSFYGEALSEIIRAEHTAILDLVLERGYMITKERHEDAMKSAMANDLESMVEFLETIKIAE